MKTHRKKYYSLIFKLFLFIVAYSLQSGSVLAATVVADGTERSYTGNIIEDENGAYGGSAVNGGVLHILGDVDVNGENSIGVHSYKGSALDINGNVEVSGKNSFGAYASNDATITVNGDIDASGQGTTAAYADKKGNLMINGKISASGNNAIGIWAYDGSKAELNGNIEANGGYWVYGARSFGQNSKLSINGDINIDIGTEDNTFGLDVQNGARAEIHGNISVKGNYWVYGVNVDSSGSRADVYGNVTVAGERARGAFAYGVSTLYMEGDIGASGLNTIGAGTEYGASLDLYGNITVTNSDSSRGASANLGSTTTVNGNITVSGSSSRAVYSDQGGTVNVNGDLTISGSTASSVSSGVNAVRSGTANVSGDIKASGAGVRGVNANNGTVKINGDIKASGTGARGVYAEDSSTVKISGDIEVSGSSATAAYARNSSIYIENSAIDVDSTTGAGIDAGTGSSVFLDNTSVNAANAKSAITTSSYGSIIADNSTHINGNVINSTSSSTYSGKTLDISLSGRSSLTGSINDTRTYSVTNLTLSGRNDIWYVCGDSNMNGALVNNGVVDYTSSGALSKVTLGDLKSDVSDAGFVMKISVPDEDSDRLIITGTADGTYILNVNNSGTGNPHGNEVFTLIETARDQNVSFTLGNEVEIGAWQYSLRHVVGLQTSFAPDGEAWQLYGTAISSNTGDAAINSFAGSYLLAYAETQTLIQRLGDLRETPLASGLWFRVHGGKYESKAKNYVKNLDVDYGGVQIGYDRKVAMGWDGSAYAGVMFGYSKGDLSYMYSGSGKVDAKTVGVYGVWTHPSGFFADLVLKYQWMKNDFDILDSSRRKVTGNGVNTDGFGASLEFGRRIPFSKEQRDGWYIEPQIQLSYQRQDGGYFTASNGTHIGVEPFTSLLARVGALIGYETEKSNFYAKISKVREFDGDLTVVANHGEHIRESFGGSWWVCGIGFTSKINDRHSLYFDLERAGGGSFTQPWRLTAGWRQTF